MPLFDRDHLRGSLRTLGFPARAESRTLPPAENQLPLLAAYTSGDINTSNALAIADVWACVRLLSATASSLPLHVFRKSGAGRERVSSGALVELLENPGPGVTQADLISSLMAHVLIWGNAYLAKYRQAGVITQIGLLDPDRVRPELENGSLRFRYTPGTGPQQMLTTSDVVHVKSLAPDSLVGVSPVSQAARVLNLSDQLLRHALSYFDVGTASPAGVLTLGPESTFDQGSRAHEQMRNEARHGGVLVVQGDASYEQIAQRMDDSQFVEQRRLVSQGVAACFGVPSHLLNAGTGGDSLHYSSSESMSADFVKYSLGPWLRRIELALSGDRDLTSQRQYVRFEVDGLLRATARDRAEIYKIAGDPVVGWMTRAEIRALEDLPPEDGAAAPSVEQMVATATNGTQSPQEVATNGN